jgi:DNA helicase-2/ATP-dependent DNA helicase PcrA
MLNDALRYMGYAISAFGYTGSGNYKQLCPKHIDQISWRLFLKRLLDLAVMACPFDENGQNILWPLWISSLKVFLKNNWLSFLNPANDFLTIKAKIRTPNHCTELTVKNLGNFKPIHNVIRTTTIHSVKGETLDAVLLISHQNKKSGGGHHSHWIKANAKDEEHVRYAFVACSRPKHLLVLATPKLSAKEITDSKAIGFSKIEVGS